MVYAAPRVLRVEPAAPRPIGGNFNVTALGSVSWPMILGPKLVPPRHTRQASDDTRRDGTALMNTHVLFAVLLMGLIFFFL